MHHAFAASFPELQVTSFPSHLFFLEASGFVKARYMPVAIAGATYSVQPILFNLVGSPKLDPADVLEFTEVCFSGALHELLTVQVEDVDKASFSMSNRPCC